MTDDATTIVTESTAPEAPAASPASIPGNPAQTQATVKRFQANPAEAEYVFSQLGYDQTAKAALAEAQKARIESATYQAAVKYGIPEDKLSLIADTTPEGILQRAAQLAPLLVKSAPAETATQPGTPPDATPPAKSAGIPLPPVATGAQKIDPNGVKDALAEYFAANPMPKPE